MKYICPECSAVISVEDGTDAESVVCESCGRSVLRPKTALGPGGIIGDFIIRKRLGSGAMGTVFLAHQISLERPVALKILHASLAEDRRCIERIMKEARTAASFNHPNLIQAYAVGEENGVYFLAMEYVEGQSLEDLLAKETRLDPERAVEIICQVAAGLDAAWRRAHIVHGDIKPENVMLGEDGAVKIADMGLAQFGRQDPENFEYNTEVTGSPSYMSPEMVLGQPVDHRSDLYSLGVTFFQTVTGSVPFEGMDILDVASKHLCAPIPSPRDLVPEIPDRICRIIAKLMAKDPRDRFQSAAEVIGALHMDPRKTVTLDRAATVAYSAADSWQCLACGHRNPLDGKFCQECGAYGFEACPKCGEDVYVDARYCSFCGTNLLQQKEVIQQTWESMTSQLTHFLEARDLERASQVAERMLNMDASHLPDSLIDGFRDELGLLRKELETNLNTARSELHLDELERSLNCLACLFGADSYEVFSKEFEHNKEELANGLYEANAAFKTNCYTKCREVLERIPAWQGGTLGDRRTELLRQTLEAEQSRQELLDQAAQVLEGEGNHADAVRLSYELSKCRISQKVLVVEPAAGDLAANTQIGALGDALRKRAVQGIETWVAENRWAAVLDLMRSVRKCESPYMAVQERALWKSLNDEIRRRYNEARLRERRGSVGHAQRAWNDILLIPGELLPSKVRHEAKGFSDRCRSLLAASRRPSLGLQFSVIFFLWCFTFCFEGVELLKLWMEGTLEFTVVREAAVPLGMQLLVLGILSRVLWSRRVLSGGDLIPGIHPSWYMMLLCLAWILGPASSVIYQCYYLVSGHLFSGPAWSDLWHAAGIVALFWALSDFLRLRYCHGFPNALALTLSWMVAAGVTEILWGTQVWTSVRHMAGAGIQAIVFVLIEVANYLINQRRPFSRAMRRKAVTA